jgi:hypothetical protein
MEKNKLEQNYELKFWHYLAEDATNIYERFSKHLVMIFYHMFMYFCWYNDFIYGKETAGHEPRSGSLVSLKNSTKVELWGDFFGQDLDFRIQTIADKLNVNECMVHQIVTRGLNKKICVQRWFQKI